MTTTNQAYDLEQASTGLRSVLMGVAMMIFLHLYMKYDAPLFLQSLMPLKAVYENSMCNLFTFVPPNKNVAHYIPN